MRMNREAIGVFTLTIVSTALLIVLYAYFVGAPINRISKEIAMSICLRLGPKCDPSTLR